MRENHNLLSRRRDALGTQTKAFRENLDADGIPGWGAYTLLTAHEPVMFAMIVPNHGNGRMSHGVVLLWNRTMDEANA